MNEQKKVHCMKYLQSRRYVESENKLVIRTIEQLESAGITDYTILRADPRQLVDIIYQIDREAGRTPQHKRRIMCINRYIDFLQSPYFLREATV